MDYTKVLLEIIVFTILPQGVWCYDKALLGIIASSVVAGVFFILIVVMAIMVTIWEDIEIAKGKVKIPRHRYNRFRVYTPDSSTSPAHSIEMTGVPVWGGVPPPVWRETEPIQIPSDHSHTEDQVEREFYFTQRTPNSDPAVIISEPNDDHSHQTGYDYQGTSNRTSSSTNMLSTSSNRFSGSTHRVSGTTGNTTLPSSVRNSHGAHSAVRLTSSNLSRAHSEVLLVPGSEMTMDGHRAGSIATLDRMTETDEKVTSF